MQKRIVELDNGLAESEMQLQAAAERLQALRDVTAAEARLDRFRCHMVQRGIGAGPIRPSSSYGYCPLPISSK